MRHTLLGMLGAMALVWGGASWAQDGPLPIVRGAGSPGTATPQPYGQPRIQPLPRTPSGNPPLLRDGGRVEDLERQRDQPLASPQRSPQPDRGATPPQTHSDE
ncbi:hypothetical protein [Pseudomonas sp. RIT-PI-AD]|uniref:hypothetical protein n=1 Tax=Pseudomonas sp. RIT-PI-AD TaxID=3035294 RepID=UPI0021D8834C|nr:hypothetical protein [Pseudomonas sp. RIT-PI-AD]